MIAFVSNGSVLQGPAAYDVSAMQEALFVLGYTRQAGVFTDPDGNPCQLPDSEPTTALELAGCRILPVVDVAEDAPAGKMQSGTRLVINGDVVERRPNWVDAPAPPGPSTIFTPFAFSQRMTFAEQVAIEAASVGDPAIRVVMRQFQTAQDIDLNNQACKDGIGLLVSKGLLTQDRATAIMTP